MRPLFERGLAKPLIAGQPRVTGPWARTLRGYLVALPFSLENLRKAHARMDSGHGKGKIVLTLQA